MFLPVTATGFGCVGFGLAKEPTPNYMNIDDIDHVCCPSSLFPGRRGAPSVCIGYNLVLGTWSYIPCVWLVLSSVINYPIQNQIDKSLSAILAEFFLIGAGSRGSPGGDMAFKGMSST